MSRWIDGQLDTQMDGQLTDHEVGSLPHVGVLQDNCGGEFPWIPSTQLLCHCETLRYKCCMSDVRVVGDNMDILRCSKLLRCFKLLRCSKLLRCFNLRSGFSLGLFQRALCPLVPLMCPLGLPKNQ